MRYQDQDGKIFTRDELRELFVRCNPLFGHDEIEFEMNLQIDIQNGTLNEVQG